MYSLESVQVCLFWREAPSLWNESYRLTQFPLLERQTFVARELELKSLGLCLHLLACPLLQASILTRIENGCKKITVMNLTFPIAMDSHVANIIMLKEGASRV